MRRLMWRLVVIALKRRVDKLRGQQRVVGQMVMKSFDSADAVPNIVDSSECAEIFVMWSVVNDTSEPLEQFSSHTKLE